MAVSLSKNGSEDGTLRKHARQGGFPADVVAQVRTVIDPTTAEV